MPALGDDSSSPRRPVGYKVIDLVVRPPSDSRREDRERVPAVDFVCRLFNRLLAQSELFSTAPFECFFLVIGILDVATPKRPRLGRLSRTRRELHVEIEFNWNVVRHWSTADWIAALVPLVRESIGLVAKRYHLPIAKFDSAYESWLRKDDEREADPR